ncbi:MAG: hypothetical protein KGL39_00040 [Patescibacteria group bacterium]|nr:hypothetical protein [Patescibacteria group bacterium]
MRNLTDHGNDGINEKLRIEVEDDQRDPRKQDHTSYHFYAHRFGQWQPAGDIKFPKGPAMEEGPEHVTNEMLIAVVMDRLRAFLSEEKDPRARYEHDTALLFLETALDWMKKRVKSRWQGWQSREQR